MSQMNPIYTVVAKDKTSKIVGALLISERNMMNTVEKIQSTIPHMDAQLELLRTMHLFYHDYYHERKLTERVLDLNAIDVDNEYKGKNINVWLVYYGLEAAYGYGFKRCVCETTNNFSMYQLIKSGFQPIYKILYDEIQFKGDRPLLGLSRKFTTHLNKSVGKNQFRNIADACVLNEAEMPAVIDSLRNLLNIA